MSHEFITRKYPRCIATISAGFEKGDFLVREEKGQRVYFDFFEEAFNYIAAKGYSRMPKGEEAEWMDLMVRFTRHLFEGRGRHFGFCPFALVHSLCVPNV